VVLSHHQAGIVVPGCPDRICYDGSIPESV